jgi:hypothetical protein
MSDEEIFESYSMFANTFSYLGASYYQRYQIS